VPTGLTTLAAVAILLYCARYATFQSPVIEAPGGSRGGLIPARQGVGTMPEMVP
jgi:hypothetical protein